MTTTTFAARSFLSEANAAARTTCGDDAPPEIRAAGHAFDAALEQYRIGPAQFRALLTYNGLDERAPHAADAPGEYSAYSVWETPAGALLLNEQNSDSQYHLPAGATLPTMPAVE